MSEEYDYDYEYDDKGEIVYYAVRPNKTQIKKDMAVLFALSEEMSELSATQLKCLDLPETIHKAVVDVSGMPHKGARKRLLKFITGQLHKNRRRAYFRKIGAHEKQKRSCGKRASYS